jgi:hypothetical protein
MNIVGIENCDKRLGGASESGAQRRALRPARCRRLRHGRVEDAPHQPPYCREASVHSLAPAWRGRLRRPGPPNVCGWKT